MTRHTLPRKEIRSYTQDHKISFIDFGQLPGEKLRRKRCNVLTNELRDFSRGADDQIGPTAVLFAF